MPLLKGTLSRRLLLSVAAAAATVLAVPVLAAASAGVSPVVGHLYVNDNTAGANTIGAFDRHADGTLTPEAGSPFVTGGAGTGATLPSQGSLQSSPDGRFLIAADTVSNQISVLGVNADGSLRQLPGGLVPSGGLMPVSVTVEHDLVYVANAGKGGSNYTGFRLHRDGRLMPIPGSTVSLPDASQPGDVLFNRDGSKLAATRVGSSLIDSFTVGADGRLSAAPGSPFPAQGLGPFGSEFRPTDPSQLFVSNAHNVGAGTGTVSAFRDSADGTLTSIDSSPFPNGQTATCWVEISHTGHFLFAVNTASGTVSSYSISPDGALALVSTTPVSTTSPGHAGAVDARLSPDGRYLYDDLSAAGAIASFSVQGASLSLLAGSPTQLPVGAAPSGIVVT